MGFYFQDCQKSVYKAAFRPSEVACPHTWNYVELTEEVKQKISREKMPQFSDKIVYPTLDRGRAEEKSRSMLI